MSWILRSLAVMVALSLGSQAQAQSCDTAKDLHRLYTAMAAAQASDGTLSRDAFQALRNMRTRLPAAEVGRALTDAGIGNNLRETLAPLVSMGAFSAVPAGEIIMVEQLRTDRAGAAINRAIGHLRALDCPGMIRGTGPLAGLTGGLGQFARLNGIVFDNRPASAILTPAAGLVTLALLLSAFLLWQRSVNRKLARRHRHFCRLPVSLLAEDGGGGSYRGTVVALSMDDLRVQADLDPVPATGAGFRAVIDGGAYPVRVQTCTPKVAELIFARPLSSSALQGLLALSDTMLGKGDDSAARNENGTPKGAARSA